MRKRDVMVRRRESKAQHIMKNKNKEKETEEKKERNINKREGNTYREKDTAKQTSRRLAATDPMLRHPRAEAKPHTPMETLCTTSVL